MDSPKKKRNQGGHHKRSLQNLTDFNLKSNELIRSSIKTARSLNRSTKSISTFSQSIRNPEGSSINPLNLIPIQQKRHPSFSIGHKGASSFYSPSVDPPFLLPVQPGMGQKLKIGFGKDKKISPVLYGVPQATPQCGPGAHVLPTTFGNIPTYIKDQMRERPGMFKSKSSKFIKSIKI